MVLERLQAFVSHVFFSALSPVDYAPTIGILLMAYGFDTSSTANSATGNNTIDGLLTDAGPLEMLPTALLAIAKITPSPILSAMCR
ncbi:MAG: hypothetical protein AAGI69_20410 [Cyanobacteria bacterium P01_H01_bin.21]